MTWSFRFASFAWVLVGGVLLTTTATGQRLPLTGEVPPPRAGVERLDPDYDFIKPLAVADSAGFTISSDVMIGSFRKDWVGGLSLADRKHLWWQKAPAPMTAPPGSIGSWVMLGFQDGTVMKVEAVSGKVLWKVNLDSFVNRPFVLAGTKLIVVTAAQNVYGLDFQTGASQWIFDGGFPDELTMRGGAAPIVHSGKVIVGLHTGELIALSMETGKLQWRYNPSYNEARFHNIVGQLVIRDEKLYLTRFDGLLGSISLRGAARELTWQEKLPSLITSVYREGRMYIGAVNGDVYAYDLSGERQVWKTNIGDSVTEIVAAEELVYVAGANGRVAALKVGDGDFRWVDDIGGDIGAAPLIYNKQIIFSTGLRNLYSYSL